MTFLPRMPTAATRTAAAALALLFASASPGIGEDQDLVARGDAAWAGRGEGRSGSRADGAPIAEAVESYGRALEAAPTDLNARWKLLQALYFQGEHAVTVEEEKLAIFERGKDLAEEGIDQLTEGLGDREALSEMKADEVASALTGQEAEAAAVFFWGAAHWGMWGQHRGKIAAAKQGVAGRIRDYARIVIALDERFEDAGGHRVLGRLHTEAPKLPFFTGWIDRDLAVAELERAVELAPDKLLNRLYLAEAIYRFRKSRRQEAVSMLEDLVGRTPDPDWVVEDTQHLEDARALLQTWGH